MRREESFDNKYKVLGKIGEGSFSEVVKVELRDSKETFAAKKLKKTFKTMQDVMGCAEIIATQKLCQHPNVLGMLEYIFDASIGKVTFIFELMDMSMYEYLKNKKRSSESKVQDYLYQILKGLYHLHRNGVFHRDIKPENILVKIQNKTKDVLKEKTLVKLADLGSVRSIFSEHPYTEYISTRWYRSPECLLTVGNYGPKMDVWAVGCVFYEFLTLKPLFPGTNEIDQLSRIHALLGTPSQRVLMKFKKRSKNFECFPRQVGSGLGPLLCNISEDAQAIMKQMLSYDPETRITVRRLLEHRYFARLREDEVYGKRKYAPTSSSAANTKVGRGDFNSSSPGIWQYQKFKSKSLAMADAMCSNSAGYPPGVGPRVPPLRSVAGPGSLHSKTSTDLSMAPAAVMAATAMTGALKAHVDKEQRSRGSKASAGGGAGLAAAVVTASSGVSSQLKHASARSRRTRASRDSSTSKHTSSTNKRSKSECPARISIAARSLNKTGTPLMRSLASHSKIVPRHRGQLPQLMGYSDKGKPVVNHLTAIPLGGGPNHKTAPPLTSGSSSVNPRPRRVPPWNQPPSTTTRTSDTKPILQPPPAPAPDPMSTYCGHGNHGSKNSIHSFNVFLQNLRKQKQQQQQQGLTSMSMDSHRNAASSNLPQLARKPVVAPSALVHPAHSHRCSGPFRSAKTHVDLRPQPKSFQSKSFVLHHQLPNRFQLEPIAEDLH